MMMMMIMEDGNAAVAAEEEATRLFLARCWGAFVQDLDKAGTKLSKDEEVCTWLTRFAEKDKEIRRTDRILDVDESGNDCSLPKGRRETGEGRG